MTVSVVPRFRASAVAILALLAIALSLYRLHATRTGLSVAHVRVGSTPVTIYRPQSGRAVPVILIAHGFAGSQQLMQAFATTFARNGYIAVSFDLRGHGRNPLPLTGSITSADGATRTLTTQTAAIAAYARALGDGRLAILGHSMSSDIVVRYAETRPDLAATIAVSMFSPAVTATQPRNLLVIVGGWEAGLKQEAVRAVAKATAPNPAVEGVTYGSFFDGSARRASFSPHVEHISVLYSQASMASAMSWLDAAFGVQRRSAPYLDGRGPWIMLLIVAVVTLGWPLSRLLPLVARTPAGAGLGWSAIWPCLAVPAVTTPLVLRFVPTHFLPILVGDYLALHFALYGIIVLLCLRWRPPPRVGPRPTTSWWAFVAAVLAFAAFGAIGLGWTIDSYVTSFVPVAARVPLILAMLGGTLAYFLSDEWLTRGVNAACGAYPASKFAFILSLALAVVLDFERLFFLVIIVPIIAIIFLIYGLFSRWSYRATGHPLVAGTVSAIAFA